MTQSTLNQKTQALGDAQPAYKVGETGNTVVYIFPSGNACVKKGKKGEDKAAPAVAIQPKPPAPLQHSSALLSSAMAAPSIGDRLVQAGLITANQLQVALYDQQSMNLDLGEVLSARGWMDEAMFQTFLSA